MTLKSIGKGVGGTMLVIFLSFFVLFVGLSNSTEPDILRPAIVEIYSEQLKGENVISQLREMCGEQKLLTVELGGEKVAVDCDKIRNGDEKYISSITSDVSNASDEQLGKAFDDIYYAEYDCEFIECLTSGDRGFLALFSEKGNEFMKSSANILGILALVSAAILFFSSTGWGKAKMFGVSFIFVGITYFFIIGAQGGISIPGAEPLVSLIFGSILNYYLIILVAGIILIALGYAGPRLSSSNKKS